MGNSLSAQISEDVANNQFKDTESNIRFHWKLFDSTSSSSRSFGNIDDFSHSKTVDAAVDDGLVVIERCSDIKCDSTFETINIDIYNESSLVDKAYSSDEFWTNSTNSCFQSVGTLDDGPREAKGNDENSFYLCSGILPLSYKAPLPAFEYVNEDEEKQDDDFQDYYVQSQLSQKKTIVSCVPLLSLFLIDYASKTNNDRSEKENEVKLFMANKVEQPSRSRSYIDASATEPNPPCPYGVTNDSSNYDKFVDDVDPIPESVIDDMKELWIVTTAALPWYTGTAVNPLLRAAYFAKSRYQRLMFAPENDEDYNSDRKSHFHGHTTPSVHLVIPWLELEADRIVLYGSEWSNKTQEYQRSYIIDWLKSQFTSDNGWLPCSDKKRDSSGLLQIHFYNGRYHSELGSVFPMGDICSKLAVRTADAICVLEEPEHLSYFRAPSSCSWRDTFKHVVGVIHTNYPYYAAHSASSRYSLYRNGRKSSKTASLLAGSVELISAWMVQAYCDKVIKLSGALPVYAASKETVAAVHGIRSEFLDIGRSLRNGGDTINVKDSEHSEVYFIGKLLWAKGLDEFLELQRCYYRTHKKYFTTELYGSGPDQEEIKSVYLNTTPSLPVKFCGRIDHASLGGMHKIFINPSRSEVLCTTTAEAIAMGKFAIVCEHPSNEFFKQFPNCRTYTTPDEFVLQLEYCLSHSPVPLSLEHSELLTWEAATERFIHASTILKREHFERQKSGIFQQESRLAAIHALLGSGRKGDVLRKVCGGGPCAEQYKYEQLAIM